MPAETLVNDTVWVHLPEKKELEAITAEDLKKATEGLTVKGKTLLITTGYDLRLWLFGR